MHGKLSSICTHGDLAKSQLAIRLLTSRGCSGSKLVLWVPCCLCVSPILSPATVHRADMNTIHSIAT